jgi:hypothetical protein
MGVRVLDGHVIVEHCIHFGGKQVHLLIRPRAIVVIRQALVQIARNQQECLPGGRIDHRNG